jgi:protoporphyrinogen oxidase
VRVLASTVVSGLQEGARDDILDAEITARAARQAYEQAGLAPADVDVVELHDAFTIAELLYYEALGLAPHGEAVSFLHSGATALGGRVPRPDLEETIEGALQPIVRPQGADARFGYPLRGGLQALMDGFVPLLNCETALKTAVLHVSPTQRTVRLDDGRLIGFESLISTMPLPELIKLMGDEVPESVQRAAAQLQFVSVRCVNLGIGRADLTEKHWIYYPGDTLFHRIFVQGNASPHCNPPGGFGLTCEITYNATNPLALEGDALVERCRQDCILVGMITEDDPLLCASEVDMPYAYVVYDHARSANVALIRQWLLTQDIHLSGRYSEWEYYNSDHAFLAGKRAAENVRLQHVSERTLG